MAKRTERRRRRTGWGAGGAILFSLFAGTARAQGFAENPAYRTARGPISIRNARPYNLLFLQFLPESPDTLPSRADRFQLQFDFINNLLIPAPRGGATVIEDNEYQRVTLSWRRGVGRGMELGVFVPILWRNGGFMDALLSGWHSLFGIPGNGEDDPAGRESYPKYRSILRVVDANGNVLVDQGNGFGLGEVTLTLKRGLTRATPRSALALRLGLKLPTGNPTLLLGSGRFDLGLTLDARYNVGRDIILYGSVGGALLGRAGRVPGAQNSMFQAFGGLEYRPNNRDSFFFQIDGNSLAARTGAAFADRAAITATFGYKRVLDRHLVLFASFTENGDFHNYTLHGLSNIGPDFTVSTGLEWHP